MSGPRIMVAHIPVGKRLLIICRTNTTYAYLLSTLSNLTKNNYQIIQSKKTFTYHISFIIPHKMDHATTVKVLNNKVILPCGKRLQLYKQNSDGTIRFNPLFINSTTNFNGLSSSGSTNPNVMSNRLCSLHLILQDVGLLGSILMGSRT